MSLRRWVCVLASGVVLVAVSVTAQSGARPGYDVAFIGPPLADPVLQHAKETYVLYGCAYCHGVNLVPRGEATDLRRSAIVAGDVNANLIGPLLRAGIPQTAKLSPMPQFSDLSDQQIGAIAAWIHYARGEDRYKAFTSGTMPAGNAAAGKTHFDRTCASCHSVERDLAGIGRKYDAAALRAQVLKPKALNGELSYEVDRLMDTRAAAARQQHRQLLENDNAEQVADVVAYLQRVR